MSIRLIAAGVASLIVIGMAAVMVRVWSDTRRVTVSPRNTSGLARILNQARDTSPTGPDTDWTVTKVNSAHGAMVVEVETPRLYEARSIAVQIVQPMRLRGYEEILIYVREPGGGIDNALRRIQWTPKGGFVETGYEAAR